MRSQVSDVFMYENDTRRWWKLGFGLHLLFVLTIIVAAYLAGIPNWIKLFPQFDLLGHAVLIGMLAFFLDGALGFRVLLGSGGPVAPLLSLRLGPLVVLTLAGAEEMAQALSPNRTASFADFAADLFGVVLFSTLALLLERRRVKSRRNPPL